MSMDQETEDKPRKSKRERFLTVAERRTVRLLRDIRLLGNCGNRSAYEYTQEDVEKIFSAIQHEISRVRDRFGTPKEIRFSLGERKDQQE